MADNLNQILGLVHALEHNAQNTALRLTPMVGEIADLMEQTANVLEVQHGRGRTITNYLALAAETLGGVVTYLRTASDEAAKAADDLMGL